MPDNLTPVRFDTRPLFQGVALSFCTYTGARPRFNPQIFESNGILCPDRIAQSVPSRQLDFLLGRLCARMAVRRFYPECAAEIPIGSYGEPLFPFGLSGSISHTKGYVVAVCQRDYRGSVGLDVERIIKRAQTEKIGASFASATEIDYPGWGDTPQSTRYTLVFSAKEAAYKALFPWVRRVLDFHDVRVSRVALGQNVLTLALPTCEGMPLPPTLDVQFKLQDDHIITFAIIPRSTSKVADAAHPLNTSEQT